MPRSTRQIFRYHCPSCGHSNTTKCSKCGVLYRFDPTLAPGEVLKNVHLTFGNLQLDRMRARSKMLGISVNEFVRMAVYDTLSLPATRLLG